MERQNFIQWVSFQIFLFEMELKKIKETIGNKKLIVMSQWESATISKMPLPESSAEILEDDIDYFSRYKNLQSLEKMLEKHIETANRARMSLVVHSPDAFSHVERLISALEASEKEPTKFSQDLRKIKFFIPNPSGSIPSA